MFQRVLNELLPVLKQLLAHFLKPLSCVVKNADVTVIATRGITFISGMKDNEVSCPKH